MYIAGVGACVCTYRTDIGLYEVLVCCVLYLLMVDLLYMRVCWERGTSPGSELVIPNMYPA